MTPRCDSPVSDDDLLDYWTKTIADAAAERIEEHLFSCAGCAARLEAMASMGAGLAALVRRGRVAGVLSRALLNRIQRDGVQVRVYSMAPGETVPCAAFPGDDLLVLSLRGHFAGSDAVTLSLTGPDDAVVGLLPDVPVAGTDVEILWATPGDSVRRMPSARFRVTVASAAPGAAVLAEYELDHTALPSA
jgi:hypothetical protein